MAGFEARVDQAPPDLRKLLHPRAEKVDALAAGDFCVETEVACDLADDYQLLGRDLSARDAGDHAVGPVTLDVGQEVVVGVLQRGLLAVEDVAVAPARQDRSDGRLADVAAAPAPVLGDEQVEGVDLLYPD